MIPPAVAMSDDERERAERVERLARGGEAGVGALLELLGEPSWAVRRTVIAALARIGACAVPGLCAVLEGARDDETRLAAAVDALSATTADVDSEMLDL